jgi:hypothetical protein
MKLSIKRLGYSSNPWRVVDEAGNELWQPAAFDHPQLGRTRIDEPLCGNTKQEVVDKVLAVVASMMVAGRKNQPAEVV